jgi:ATP-dependent DNA ligase
MSLELPTLYLRSRDGAIVQWAVTTDEDVVIVHHGKVGGKLSSLRDRVRSTNEGRANARVGAAQAEFEAQAAWEKKRKEGYSTSMEEARDALILMPMLAHPIMKTVTRQKKKMKIMRDVKYPMLAQRKYNGLRCMCIWSDGSPLFGMPAGIYFRSREGVEWKTLGHIEAAVREFAEPGMILDGEIYLHGVPLQIIGSRIHRLQPETAQLQYVLYDLPICPEGKSAQVRNTALQKRYWEWSHKRCDALAFAADEENQGLATAALPLQVAPTWIVTDDADMRVKLRVSLLAGYEGLILRQMDREYEFNERCDGLLKVKLFTDTEFLVVDALSREYYPPGQPKSVTILDKFVCQNNLNEKTFEVVPVGTMAKRQEFWENRKSYIGQRLTVRYLERSVDGIPQGNPVGKGFRLLEDLGPAETEEKLWD